MDKEFDYVSILAGGICPMKCEFCVGQFIRKNEHPHFADIENIKIFLELYKNYTNKLSISGSTSDPLFVKNLEEIISFIPKSYEIALHTCATKQLLNFNHKLVDKLRISIHNIPDNDVIDFIRKNQDKVRVGTVYFDSNKNIIDSMELFDKIPSKSFTVRKNIFKPETPKFIKNLKKVNTVFNQPIYQYKDKQIAIWDFADANKYIKARYLWPDGKNRRQCYWHNLHNINFSS
jgi:MoaA/NifB/PqqE/SkfB family radical SAM enzyme